MTVVSMSYQVRYGSYYYMYLQRFRFELFVNFCPHTPVQKFDLCVIFLNLCVIILVNHYNTIMLPIDASKKNGTRLVGDVDFKEAKMKASWITPVPGGKTYT